MPQRLGVSQSRNNLISDGIYEEMNFRMVFLVKGPKIYRLLFNHVNESGIISREIDSTDKYIVTESDQIDSNILTLQNGFLFKKINTNKKTVTERVKVLYDETRRYLNRKFYERSPSEYTESLSKTDDLSVVSPVVSPVVPADVPSITDLTSDINRNSEEYERLINELSVQRDIISELQQESDTYRVAGLKIIEQFKRGHADSLEEIQELKQIQQELQKREELLRRSLQLYDEKLKEANSENKQLHGLMEIDSEINKLKQDHAFKEGKEQALSEAQARVTLEHDRNVELERRRRKLALLAHNNKSLVMENQVLQKRLTSVIQLLGESGGSGDITDKISLIIEQLQKDHEASIEIMRQDNERNQEIITDRLDHCNRRLQKIEAENQQFIQDIYSKDSECEGARHRQAEQFDVEMESQ